MANKIIHTKRVKQKKQKTKKQKNKKTKKNSIVFNSGNGMLTKVWGPALWHYMHIMSFNYPVSPTNAEKQCYKTFIKNLPNILPCKYCRINLKKNQLNTPITSNDLKNRNNFALYIYKLHEKINHLLNKKSNLTFNDIRERYEYFRSNCFKKEDEKKIIGEKGCTDPVNGAKSKCIIKIVPQTEKDEDSIQIDKRCIIYK
jgi:hypothetical protein